VTRVRGRRVAAAAALAAAVAAVAIPGARAAPAAPAAQPSAAAAGAAENAFALALLPRLGGGGGNLVYSPYSVAVALAMADAGARGATAAQIATVLHASSPAAELAAVRVLRTAIAAAATPGASAPTLDVANALWTQTGLPIQSSFVVTLGSAFGAPPYRIDFEAAPQAALQTINGWVSSHTDRIIPSVLPPGSITSATRFVLANAIYLKARWATQFDPSKTRPMPFTTGAGRRVSVPFMSADDVLYPYAAGAGYQAVDLPYASSSLSLLALLPVGQSLAALEHTLGAGRLASIVAALRPQATDLLIPKLHVRTQTSLNAALHELGVTAAFGPGADFRGITTAAPLEISLVEHAADLRLDEQGTVAAAATVVVGPTAIALPRGRVVTVDLDRPFLLLLREDHSGAVLFVAQVSDPSAS